MELLFSVSGLVVMPAWFALAGIPFWYPSIVRWIQWSVPTLLGLAYLALIWVYWGSSTGGYDSLAAVRELFTSDGLLLAGWLHYLAFDLFIGAWMVEQAQRSGIAHGWVLPCLPLTFLFGPIGLLAFYFVLLLHRIWYRTRPPQEQASA
jgi:hypothetical protein